MDIKPKSKSTYIYVGIWLAFTLALAVWWLIHGLAQADKLAAAASQSSIEISKQHSMPLWEGITFFSLVLAGGVTLFFFTLRESKRAGQMKEFFAAFTH